MARTCTQQSPCFTSVARRVRITGHCHFVTSCRFAHKLHPHDARLSELSAFCDWIIASTKTAKNSCSLTFTRGRAHPAFVDAVLSAPSLSRTMVSGLSRLSSTLFVAVNRFYGSVTVVGEWDFHPRQRYQLWDSDHFAVRMSRHPVPKLPFFP